MAKTTSRKGNYKRKASPKKRTSYKKKGSSKYTKRKSTYTSKKKSKNSSYKKSYPKGRANKMKSGAPWTNFRRTTGRALNTFYNYFAAPSQVGFSIPGKRISLEHRKDNYKSEKSPSVPTAQPEPGPVTPTDAPLVTQSPYPSDAPVPQPVETPAPVAPQQAAPPPSLEAPPPAGPAIEDAPQGRKRRADDDDEGLIGDIDRNYVPTDEDLALDADAIDEPGFNQDQSTTGALDLPVHNNQGQNGTGLMQLTNYAANAGQPGWDLTAYEVARTRPIPGLFLDPRLTKPNMRSYMVPLVEGTGWDPIGSKWELSGLWLNTTNLLSGKPVIVKEGDKQTLAVIENSWTQDAQGNRSGRNVSPRNGWGAFSRGIREKSQGHTASGTIHTATGAVGELASAYGTVKSGGAMASVPAPYAQGKKQIVDTSEPRLQLTDVVHDSASVPAPNTVPPSSPNPNNPLETYTSPQRSKPTEPNQPSAPKKQRVQGADLRGAQGAGLDDLSYELNNFPHLPEVNHPNAKKQYSEEDLARFKKVNRAIGARHAMSVYQRYYPENHPKRVESESRAISLASDLRKNDRPAFALYLEQKKKLT